FVVGLFEQSDPHAMPGRQVTVRDLVSRGRQRLDAAHVTEPAVPSRVLEVLGNVYLHLSTPESADTLLRQSIALARSVYGPRHPEVARRLTDWADALNNANQFARADSALREALAI